jgi:hypothetical protein
MLESVILNSPHVSLDVCRWFAHFLGKKSEWIEI